MAVNVAALLHAGIDLEEILLFAEPPQIKTVVENGAVLADDMDIGGVRSKTGQGTGEDAARAVGETDLNGLHGRIVIPVADLNGIAADRRDIGSEQEARQIDRMTAAENERAAAAFAFPHPAAAVASEPVVHIGQEDPSEFAVGDEAFLHPAERIEAQDQAHDGFGVIFPQRGGETVELFLGNGGGFFQKDRLAGFGGEDRLLGMKIVRSADRNDIHPAVVEQFLETAVKRDLVQTEFGNLGLSAFDAAAAESDQTAVRVAQISADMTAGDPAAAPEGASEFSIVHDATPFQNVLRQYTAAGGGLQTGMKKTFFSFSPLT